MALARSTGLWGVVAESSSGESGRRSGVSFGRTGLRWSEILLISSKSCEKKYRAGEEGGRAGWREMILLLLLTAMVAPTCATARQTPTVGVVVVEASTPEVVAASTEVLKDVLMPLSRALGLHLRVFHTTERPPTPLSLSAAELEGVVALGGCWRGEAPGVVNEKRLPVLRLLLEDCKEAPDRRDVVPVYKFKGAVGEDCLHTLLWRWLQWVAEEEVPGVSSSGGLGSRLVSCSFANITHMIIRKLNRDQPQSRTKEQNQCSGRLTSSTEEQTEEEQRTECLTHRQRVRTLARKLLNAHVLTVTMKHRPPYITLVKDGRVIVQASGILMELLDTFASTYNFTYTLKVPADDQWGSLQEDGTWTGMVGEVYRKEMEMALGPTSITEAREKAIDFTVPFDYEPWDILIPESIVSYDLTAYLFPFTTVVWAGVLVSMMVVGVVLWVLARASEDHPLLYPSRYSRRRSYSFLSYVMDIFGCLVSQGNTQPQTVAVRVLAGWWWVFCAVVVASYSSKLISSLTVRFTEPPVKSLQDLVESRKLLWTYLASSAMEEVFKNSAPDTLFGKVGQLHKDRPGLLVYSFEEGVAAVRSNKFAYFEDNSWLEFAVSDDLALHGECRMSVVRDHFFSTRFGIILQPGSPYRDAFSLEILETHQSGLMDAWKKKYWPATHCAVNANTKQPLRPLNLLDLVGTIVLLLAGFTLGGIVFLMELIVNRYYSGQSKDPDSLW